MPEPQPEQTPRMSAVAKPEGARFFRIAVLMIALGLGLLGLYGYQQYAAVVNQRNIGRAKEALRTISKAQWRYYHEDLDGNGIGDFASLEELGELGLIPAAIASGYKDSYRFELEPGPDPAHNYWMTATPEPPHPDFAVYYFSNARDLTWFAFEPITVDKTRCKPSENAKICACGPLSR